MQNTLENKAKFFAQYWGQKLLMSELFQGIVRVESFFLHKDNLTVNDYLELTPLYLISDEDAIEVAKKLSHYAEEIIIQRRENEIWCICDEYTKVIIGIVTFGLTGKYIDGEPTETNNKFSIDSIYYDDEILNSIDYLRSKCYALPFNGLSVKEQVQRGWVALKTKI